MHAPVRAGALLILLWVCLLGLVPWGVAAGTDVAAQLQRLREGNQRERHEALQWLAEAGDASAIDALVTVLQTSDTQSRAPAERALWAIWSRSGNAQADALLKTGSELLSRGEFAKSIELFDQVVLLEPTFAEGYNKRATAWYYLGEYESSLDDIRTTLHHNPIHFGALSGAALCLVALERYPEALFFVERALAVNPNMPVMVDLARRLRQAINRDAL